MIQVLFLILAAITVYLSIKLSYYADLLNKTTKISGAVIGGILLAGITSLPEFVTCLTAVFYNNPYLAIGDILGSNFFNITMICFFDIVYIKKTFLNYTSKSHYLVYLLLIINYIVMYFFMSGIFNNSIFSIGIPTIIIISTYVFYLFSVKGKDDPEVRIKKSEKYIGLKFTLTAIFMIIISILLTITVNKISAMSPSFSSSVIGAILLGITTSLPEVITFLTLLKINSYDLALSNIVGSNLFNLLVLAICDFFLKKQDIYYYTDRESLILLVFGFFAIMINLYQNNRKVKKNKLLYICPSILIVFLYIIFWIINFK